jgi:hypothetical protein
MSYSIVTPSYAGDFERCRLLAESVQRLVTGDHYILVDEVDLTEFRCLEQFGAKVIDTRDLMGAGYRRIPKTRLWLSPKGKVLRGWMTQQVRKMAFAEQGPSERILFVDSDIVFVRPFNPDAFTRDGHVPLFTTNWFNSESLAWGNQSRRLLGLPEQDTSRGYVHPTFWTRTVAQRMLDAVTNVAGRPWRDVITAERTFSEYTLYGVFAEEKVGLDALSLYSFNQPLMHLGWDYNTSIASERDRFFAELPESSYAMMFHSKHQTPVSAYEQRVRDLWSGLSPGGN